MNCDRFIILSGCSGGGKSTLLAELSRRGYATIEEPGRRIVRQESAMGGGALPWVDMRAFLKRSVALSLKDRDRAEAYTGWVFFDRGLVDAASGLAALSGDNSLARFGAAHRYHRTVFLTPPWPEIYINDAERRHTLSDARLEYDRLRRDYPSLGYQVVILPKTDVASRADFVLSHLG